MDTDDGRLLTRTARMIANSSAAPLVRANSRNSRWSSLPNPRSSGVLQIIMWRRSGKPFQPVAADVRRLKLEGLKAER